MMHSLRTKILLIFGMILTLMVVSFIISYVAVKKQQANGRVINVAGAQRMLSQKMSKEAIETSRGDEAARGALAKTAKRFDAVLNALLNGDPGLQIDKQESPGVRTRLAAVQDRWVPFKARLGVIGGQDGQRYQDALSHVADNNLRLLEEMDKAVSLMEKSGTAGGPAINLAGAQRMLSQKMTKEVLLTAQGDEAARTSLEKSVARFDAVLKGLLQGDASLGLPSAANPAVANQLRVVANLWAPFRENVRVIAGDVGQRQREALDYVIRNNVNLMQDMNDAVSTMEAVSQGRLVVLQVLILVLGLAIVLLGLSLMNAWVTRPIRRLTDVVETVATGDLTQKTGIQGRDEIGRLGRNFDHMVANLGEMITRIHESSQHVAASSEEMVAVADQVTQATQQIATVVRQVAKGAADQTADAGETVTVMDQLRRAIDQIAQGAQSQAHSVSQTSEIISQMAQAVDQVARLAQEVSDEAAHGLATAAENGGEAVEQTVAGMGRIRDTALEAAGRVKELGGYSRQIGEIVQVIGGIADQTNLLALNAAIEAARAGEHGKGFAVVADEVRKLAERSGRASREIADLIGVIQKGVEAAVAAMDAGTREVQVGTELAGRVKNALDEILDVMRRTNGCAENISAAAEELAASAGEVVKAVDNVAAITEENSAATEQMAASSEQVSRAVRRVASVSEGTAASAEEVNASTEEVNASAEEISGTARSLAGMAQELQALVGRFRL